MMKKLTLGCAMAACVATPLSAEEKMMITVPRITVDVAQKIAQAAMAACREQGIQIGVTVVDRDGVPQVILRDTIAASITVPISRKKAFTAVNFNAATSAMTERGETPVGRQDFLLMSAGGLPIQVSGQLVGGVGVSGAPSGETDEACAKAGVDAVQEDLELAM